MNWQAVKLDPSSRLFYVHNLMYIHLGHNYKIEIQEYPTGEFIGFIESTIDRFQQFSPVTSDSLASCLQNLVARVSES
ncbi:MAG: hypothetical protein OXC40_06900 [Proteobacteria bacterium]|nr:hypothetical protein [Pseudomonadota bacterium]